MSCEPEGPPARHRTRPGSGIIIALLLAGACSAPAPRPLTDAELMEAVRTRPEAGAALASAWELAGLPLPPALVDLRIPGSVRPGDPAWWEACAAAHAPRVRRARRRLLAARAEAAAAGAPRPSSLPVENAGGSGPDANTEIGLVLDLLGVLGTGRSAAREALGDARARRAFADYELALWEARHEVLHRAAVLASARTRRRVASGLRSELEPLLRRAAILAERGWLGTGTAARGRALVATSEAVAARAAAEGARTRAALYVAAGRAPDNPLAEEKLVEILDVLGALVVVEPEDPAALLERHPLLRRERMAYAAAEASLRLAVAQSWPRVGLGPRLVVGPDDTLPGGILQVDLPWPGASRARVRAAVQARALQRERVEDALLERWTAVEAGVRRLGLARDQLAARKAAEVEAAAALRAQKALFMTGEPGGERWPEAASDLLASRLATIDAREEVARASLELREAAGFVLRKDTGSEP